MSSLYNNLAEIYEGMYQTFINYDEEFDFYSSILEKYHCSSVLEAGCGTGNLASRFSRNHFDYMGMDLSDDMLRIARSNYPEVSFVAGDMRNFKLIRLIQSCIITGRSTSYLVSNDDVRSAFDSIGKNLISRGLLCFDFIDAATFLPSIENGKSIIHKAIVGQKRYQRKSCWKIDTSARGAFDWQSIFYEEQGDGGLTKIGDDHSTIRCFWREEMKSFVESEGFKVEELIPRPSYAFDTIVVVAKKID
jgi:SAM-dependent methyltransferase